MSAGVPEREERIDPVSYGRSPTSCQPFWQCLVRYTMYPQEAFILTPSQARWCAGLLANPGGLDKGLDLVSNHVPYTKGLLYGDIEVPASEHKYPAYVLGFPGSAGSAAAPCVANTTPGLQLGKQTHKQCPGPCEPSLVVQSSAFHCLSLFLPPLLGLYPKAPGGCTSPTPAGGKQPQQDPGKEGTWSHCFFRDSCFSCLASLHEQFSNPRPPRWHLFCSDCPALPRSHWHPLSPSCCGSDFWDLFWLCTPPRLLGSQQCRWQKPSGYITPEKKCGNQGRGLLLQGVFSGLLMRYQLIQRKLHGFQSFHASAKDWSDSVLHIRPGP